MLGWLLVCIVATGPREQALSIYRAMSDSGRRLEADVSRLPESVPADRSWALLRDGGPAPAGDEAWVLEYHGSDGALQGRTVYRVPVRRFEKVPVARVRLERGVALDTSNVSWQWQETTRVRARPPREDSLHLLRMKSTVVAGQPLWMDRLQLRSLFPKGSQVRVEAGTGGTQVFLEAEAMEEGVPGEALRVRTPWGRLLRCRVRPDGAILAIH